MIERQTKNKLAFIQQVVSGNRFRFFDDFQLLGAAISAESSSIIESELDYATSLQGNLYCFPLCL